MSIGWIIAAAACVTSVPASAATETFTGTVQARVIEGGAYFFDRPGIEAVPIDLSGRIFDITFNAVFSLDYVDEYGDVYDRMQISWGVTTDLPDLLGSVGYDGYNGVLSYVHDIAYSRVDNNVSFRLGGSYPNVNHFYTGLFDFTIDRQSELLTGSGHISAYVVCWFCGDATMAFDFEVVSGRGMLVIPEPASWAMFIAGFGVTGGALRRRNVTLNGERRPQKLL